MIPVVGNFSAGKSTLLNRFLGSSVLPTGITPETSLATELHYSANQRIEAFSNNDEKAESFELNEQSFEVIKENAPKYSYLKVYLNNEALKNSAPLVFVDMPGFDSPISSHTHAKYLERGVHFVILASILASVEEGALTKRMVRELKNLLEFDKGLSFILSKTNLRTPSQVEEVSHYIQDQIQDYLDLTTHLIRSDKDNNALLEVADKIDAEKLFSALYLERLKFLNSQLQNSLKSVIESFDYSKEKALEEIKALDLGVKDIEKTYEKLRANLEEEYSSVAVGSVVKKVLEDVREQKSYLAASIAWPKNLNSEIESITQQSLIKNAKLEIEKINLSFSKDFHAEFESLNKLSSDLSVNLEHGIELGINALSVILSKNPVTRPFALILQGLKPLLKDLLTLLPNIINSFFRNEEKEPAKLENLIEVKVMPEIQHKLKKVLPGLFNEALQNSLKSLKDRCELEITHKKQEIALAQTEKEKHLNDLEEQKQALENKINALSNLEQQYLED